MHKYLQTLLLLTLVSTMVSLPTQLGFFEDIPQPIKVRSFNHQPADNSTRTPGQNNQSEPPSSPNGIIEQSSAPWASLTAEPVPQRNLPLPVDSPIFYQGVRGSHKCFPGDGCYYGFWNLYNVMWLPPKYNASYVEPYHATNDE